MIELITSTVNQGRSFTLVDKALELDGSTLFITLELSDKVIMDRLKTINQIKYKKPLNSIDITVKEFPAETDVRNIDNFIKINGQNFDNIIIDQSYLVQTKNLDKNVSFQEAHRYITDVYYALSIYLDKPIYITYNLGIDYTKSENIFHKFEKVIVNTVKELEKVNEFINGKFRITNVYKKNNIVYKMEYPYDSPKNVIDLELYREQITHNSL